MSNVRLLQFTRFGITGIPEIETMYMKHTAPGLKRNHKSVHAPKRNPRLHDIGTVMVPMTANTHGHGHNERSQHTSAHHVSNCIADVLKVCHTARAI